MKAMNLTARRGVQEESGAFKKIKKEKDIIMRPNENVTYRLESRADTSRSLNVYGTTPKSLANVCLYKSDDNDICQQWLYEKKDGHEYLVCKGNSNLVLDLFTGSSSLKKVKDYNAHVYTRSNTAYLEFEETTDGYVRICLADGNYPTKYLTANQGSNGTSGGKDVDASGNVYFYAGGLTDYSQDWKLIPLNGGTTPDPSPDKGVEVTNMPGNSYTGGIEYFHPGSGMVSGTWAQNGGVSKANAVKAFYKKVFQTSSAPDDMCLYNLFGAAYAKHTNYSGKYHSGIDMYASASARIVSAHTGEVTAVGGRYGIVAIYDKDKDVTYLYLHMNTTNTEAKCNKTIYEGDFLGTQSSAGLENAGQHLHIEVRKGRQTSPAGLPTIDEALTSISPYDYL